MAAHDPALPRHRGRVGARHLQLPEVVVVGGGEHAVRAAHERRGPRRAGRRDLLRKQDALDLGRDQPAARPHRRQLLGQGHEGAGVDEVPELEEVEDGICTFFPVESAIGDDRTCDIRVVLMLKQFDTLEWSLTTEDGRTIQLLKPDSDPFRAMNAGQEESAGLA